MLLPFHTRARKIGLDQLEEIKAYLLTGDAGEILSEQALLDMFANTGGNGSGHFTFTSDRQLKNKTFAPDLDVDLFEDLFAKAAMASQAANSGAMAANGTAGLITRQSKGTTILVDENGREFTQLIEKGLMGAVLYNQVYNTYLSDDRIGAGVENVTLSEGRNYTAMEHHMDEAFGVLGSTYRLFVKLAGRARFGRSLLEPLFQYRRCSVKYEQCHYGGVYCGSYRHCKQ